jgi:acetolactate decarboxylase
MTGQIRSNGTKLVRTKVVAQKNSILHVPTQFGTVNNLLINQELYGKFKYGDIIKKGNFGVGTFNGLDGEMVAVDGQFYQIDTKLNARIVRNNQETPIAKVINFPEKVDIQETCREISSIEKLIKYLHPLFKKIVILHVVLMVLLIAF